MRSSIMYHEWESSELCSTVDNGHKHSTQTAQDALNDGETTWETFLRRYSDSASPERWTLESPVERGQIVAGPDALPGDWVTGTVTNYDTDACSPFDAWVTYDGAPVKKALAWLERPGADLVQGTTDDTGYVGVFGAHNGETFWVEKEGISGSLVVSCSPGPNAPSLAPQLQLGPPAFPVDVTATAAGPGKLAVVVKAPGLAGPPVAEVNPVAGDPLPVPLTADLAHGDYRGTITLPGSSGTQGYLRILATNGAGQKVVRMLSYKLMPVPVDRLTEVRSANNSFRIFFQAGSLNGNTVVSLHDGGPGAGGQGDLVRIGDTYVAAAANGQANLKLPASLLVYYDPAAVAGETAQLHRWDAAGGRWIAVESTVDEAQHIVNARIDELGAYALLGRPAGHTIYMPLLWR